MGKKNKSADLQIASFMENVKTNVRPADDADSPIDSIPSVGDEQDEEDNLNVESTESEPQIQEKDEPVVRRGRPKKSKAIVRNTQKIIKFDDALCAEMAMVRALNKISMQDIVYVATVRFMKEYFPKGKATKEGLELLREEIKTLNGKEE